MAGVLAETRRREDGNQMCGVADDDLYVRRQSDSQTCVMGMDVQVYRWLLHKARTDEGASPASRCWAVHCARWWHRSDVVWHVRQEGRVEALEQDVIRQPWTSGGERATNDGDT